MSDADTFWGRCDPAVIAAGPFKFDPPHWREDNTCSHCGGLRPSLALEAIRKGALVEPTDKNYKIYLEVPDPRVGEDFVCSVIDFDPGDPQNWVPFDAEKAKRDGWQSKGKWMQVSKHRETHTVKCYLNHFSESQAVEFVRLYEDKTMRLEYPGHFYSGLCFGRYKEALMKGLAR